MWIPQAGNLARTTLSSVPEAFDANSNDVVVQELAGLGLEQHFRAMDAFGANSEHRLGGCITLFNEKTPNTTVNIGDYGAPTFSPLSPH